MKPIPLIAQLVKINAKLVLKTLKIVLCTSGRVNPPECHVPPPRSQSARVIDIPVGSAMMITCADDCET